METINPTHKDFKDINELRNILKRKYNLINFDNAIVKIILTENKIKTWLFITEKDFWFVFDTKEKGKIFRVNKKKINYKIEEYVDSPNFGKMFIDEVTYPIIFDKSLTGSTETFINLIDKYKK